ncbi:MAG: hypothetical protein KDA45_08610, partial [Planctomycetales bacterium]|nr:hypothetical protein [Planctomycetales bacterium]
GKKMKFCKCVEQPQEYEKLLRLIEGGQELAAMDRINQLLTKTPNAAWLLALRGELALSMQELDTFQETATRFLKLKPDNPLALIMKSLASSFAAEPVENSANYLLEGLSESRESVPMMTVLSVRLLIQSLANSSNLSMVGYWADLLEMFSTEEDEEPSVLSEPTLNLLAKVPTQLIDDAPGAAWKERLAEVVSLARAFRFSQAETKLRTILRDFPDQPGPLTHLLRAQCAQLNQQGAYNTARKLAEHLDVTPEQRAYFGAVALELEPQHKSLRPVSATRYAEIDSVERITAAMDSLDFADRHEGQHAEQFKQHFAAMVGEEVPATCVYNVFNCSLKLTEEEGQPGERHIGRSVATVALFGKQTDKPARALLLATKFAPHQQRLQEVLDVLQLGADIEGVEQPTAITYSEFLARTRMIVGTRDATSIEENGAELLHDFLNLPFEMFDGATPLEIASDERHRANLQALLSHLEGEQGHLVPATTLDEIYQRLELPRPASQLETSSETLRVVNILDLDRIDLAQLSDTQLKGVLIKAMNLGAQRVFYHSILQVRSRDSLAADAQMQLLSVSGLRTLLPTLEEKIRCSQELLGLLDAAKLPVGKVVIELVSMLHAAGKPQEAQQTMVQAADKYPDDPYLLSFLQYVMQSQRGMPSGGPDELAARIQQHGMRPAASTESGLVLPGQDASAPAGESKLWLPGS